MDLISIAVLFGGRSPEHDVSCASAASLLATIDRTRYNPLPIRIERDGTWSCLTTEPPTTVWLPPVPQVGLVHAGGGGSVASVDVAFPLIHGRLGEDGTVQGLLELAEIPYVGSGVAASAIGLNKVLMKRALAFAGLPLSRYVVLEGELARGGADAACVVSDTIGYPCFVKPASLGSSIGVSKVESSSDLLAALDVASTYDATVVVEKAIERARELEVAVIGGATPRASLVGEVFHSQAFLNYSAKTDDPRTHVRIPAVLSDEMGQRIQNLALRAFAALGCEGLARVDFLLSTSGDLYALEVNTIPGMMRGSMAPKLWAESGLSYGELIDELVQLAQERHRRNQALRKSA